MTEQMTGRPSHGALGRPDRDQSGNDPLPDHVARPLSTQERQKQQEAAGDVLDAAGRGLGAVGDPNQLLPRKPRDQAPVLTAKEVVDPELVDKVAVDHDNTGSRVPVRHQDPEHRPVFGIEEHLGEGVGIGPVPTEPLRNGPLGTRPVTTHREQMVGPEATPPHERLPRDDRPVAVPLDQHTGILSATYDTVGSEPSAVPWSSRPLSASS
ncbi:hypothetical protein ACFWRZ_02525 [Streptomyces rubiginosohelvolus]|uniref:hypothetical protein n=1 Tax=Streptomyces rubiginosohelvolus TaxID=67362 RepID=UPI0036500B2D